jgi:rhodanese-related sulfurtransferase
MTGFLSKLFGLEDEADFKSLLSSGAILLDVRTEEEYERGHVEGSVNIPLHELSDNLSKLKKDKTIIAICESGIRSRDAAGLLASKGFDSVYNGGSWLRFK